MKVWMMFVVLVAVGCQQSSVDDGEALPADYESEVGGGAADDSVFTRTALDEPLHSRGLKRKICEAVQNSPDIDPGTGADFADHCMSHQFTVTEQITSQKVVYARNGHGVTVGLKVEVVGAFPSISVSGDLRRTFGGEYDLDWDVKATINFGDSDLYLLRLSEVAGEYFSSWEDTEFADAVHSVDRAELPAHFEPVILEEIAQIEAGFSPGDTVEYGEAYRIDHPNGDVAGYVVILQFMIDDPLFDGGGTSLYINKDGVVVTFVDFWG